MLIRLYAGGEWLEWPLPSPVVQELKENGDSPHHLRQWLISLGQFPEKWLNRLYSTGGIKLNRNKLMLQMFKDYDLSGHPLYVLAMASWDEEGPDILYEDDHCLVVSKPVGMPVHPSEAGQSGTLDEAVLRHAVLTGQNVHLRHIHRLDEDTSGPVLYAKNDFAQWKLDEAMRQKQIQRDYAALVQGQVREEKFTIDLPIGRDRHHASKRRVSKEGQPAVTHVEVARRFKGLHSFMSGWRLAGRIKFGASQPYRTFAGWRPVIWGERAAAVYTGAAWLPPSIPPSLDRQPGRNHLPVPGLVRANRTALQAAAKFIVMLSLSKPYK